MGEIAEVVGGGTPRTGDSTNFEGGDVPWITPSDLSGYSEKYVSHGARFITRKGLASSSARMLPAGSVLFTSRAPIGYVAIARNPVSTNQGFKSFVLKDGVLPDYVYWWLKGSKQRAEALASGTTFLELSGANAKKIPIPIAPIDEQIRIVAEIEKQFSRLDEAVANLKRVTGGLLRYRAATLSEAFAAKPGWAVFSYGEIGVVTTGFTPPTTEAANFGGAIPFFKPTDLDAGENVVAAREHLSDRGVSKGRLIPANSVLVTCIGATIGKTGLARVACATNQQINAVSPDPAKVDAGFLYWWTVSPRGREQIVSNASATTLPILNKSKFSALAVPVPAIEDQKRIVSEIDRRLSIVREVEAEVDANLKRVRALKHAILARAFSENRHEI